MLCIYLWDDSHIYYLWLNLDKFRSVLLYPTPNGESFTDFIRTPLILGGWKTSKKLTNHTKPGKTTDTIILCNILVFETWYLFTADQPKLIDHCGGIDVAAEGPSANTCYHYFKDPAAGDGSWGMTSCDGVERDGFGLTLSTYYNNTHTPRSRFRRDFNNNILYLRQ